MIKKTVSLCNDYKNPSPSLTKFKQFLLLNLYPADGARAQRVWTEQSYLGDKTPIKEKDVKNSGRWGVHASFLYTNSLY